MFNVRLQRLGLGVIFFMSVFVVYLVYHDFYASEPGPAKALGAHKHKMAYDMYGNRHRQGVSQVQTEQRGFGVGRNPGSLKNAESSQEEEEFEEKENAQSLFDEEEDRETNYDEDGDRTTIPVFDGPLLSNSVYGDKELSQGFIDVGGAEAAKAKGLKMLGNKKKGVDPDYPKLGYKQFIGLAKFDKVANISEAREQVQQQQNENRQRRIRINGLVAPSPKLLNAKNASPSKKISDQEIIKDTEESRDDREQKNDRLRKQRRKKTDLVFPPRLLSPLAGGPSLKRYIVYVCANSSWCGGWGDRQRGIVSLYLLSRVVGRQFKILMETPCDLSQFYAPHIANWLLRPEDMRGKSSLQINSFTKDEFKDKILDGDFNDVYPDDVLFIKTNQDFYMRLRKNPVYSDMLEQWTGLRTKRGRFKWAWNELMQPTEKLLVGLQDIVGAGAMINKGLITKPLGTGSARANLNIPDLLCAHVRMGRNPTIPMDEDFGGEFHPQDIPVLQKFLASQDKKGNSRFFLATDYEGIRTEFRKFFGARLVESNGKIIHIDRQRSDDSACVGFHDALLDQLVLSVCDFLVVSRSGFSIHASHMSNSTNQVFVMEEGKIAPLVVTK